MTQPSNPTAPRIRRTSSTASHVLAVSLTFQVACTLHMANTLLTDPRGRNDWGPHGVRGLRARKWSVCRSVPADPSQSRSGRRFSRDSVL
ncbi:uncharacterized protein M421DRAFT_224988 [Didymella exigua CBS 183.55]|uniref:Uncharacterized protein n=1 Tax=Didymella exigua CBS 183.55 TaxID=1150837 RepID=A0A6A5RF51_9PLEO|nr:uncharacterized protein M421DRAFT_224988 [Didymella exigua CBS 183.55]KAF1926113.1 hypothetical protein M421DRAFT_224988 [Didymella exigua CBS 183.55]